MTEEEIAKYSAPILNIFEGLTFYEAMQIISTVTLTIAKQDAKDDARRFVDTIHYWCVNGLEGNCVKLPFPKSN